MERYQMTNEQRELLDQDHATILENLGGIAQLLHTCFGDKDPRVFRAEESQGAVQRLVWALERPELVGCRKTALSTRVRASVATPVLRTR
jgi:hypothetical protein